MRIRQPATGSQSDFSELATTVRFVQDRFKRPKMRKTLRRFLPDHEAIHTNRWLRPFANTLLHPRLWHLNRHSAAGAIAAGLFCGLIPGPFQMLTAAICCIVFRVNLPLALITTLYSNPFTIVPLYLVAYGMGALMTGDKLSGFVPPPDMHDLSLVEWAQSLLPWALELGRPLAVGLVLLASMLAVAGYFAVRAIWRIWLVRAWRARSARRRLS